MSDWPGASASTTREMELIATTTLSGAAASITFSGINTDYRFFELVGWFLKDANLGQMGVTLNGDTGVNYNSQYIAADGATIASGRATATAMIYVNIYDNMDASSVASLTMTIGKPVAGERASVVQTFSYIRTSLILEMAGADWNNTADLISSIQVKSLTNNLAIGSRVSLGGARVA